MKKRFGFLLLLAMLILGSVCIGAPRTASAATYKKQWVLQDGKYRYYNKKGKQVKGLTKIGKKYYYFDSKGRQQTGWQYIGGAYYYFTPKPGKKGIMNKGVYVDGIYLNADGKARIDNDECQRKLEVMRQCQQILQTVTNDKMNMPQKKLVMFRYVTGTFVNRAMKDLSDEEHIDMAYAEWMLEKGFGDCYAYAAVYAYFLNAIGYADPLMVSSGGHAWTELKGRIYDSNWALVIGEVNCYNVGMETSGQNNRPNWAANRVNIYHVERKF